MQTINKIIININFQSKQFPAFISYQSNNIIHKSFELNKELAKEASNILKKVKLDNLYFDKSSQLYCYDYINNTITTINNINNTDNYYIIGSNFEGIESLIRIIKFAITQKDFLIPLEIIINKKIFCLNQEILNIKKGIKDTKQKDLETYLLFLQEFHSSYI